MAEKSFPLNNTDYGAEEAQLYFATRTRGVFAGTHLAVTAAGGMAVSLGTGIAWLKNGDFGGLVYANTAPLPLTVGLADDTYPRIDRVVIRYDVQTNAVYAYVKAGTPASAPVPPVMERSSIADEISVAQVYVAAAGTEITDSNITDDRLNTEVCGLMRDGVTGIDTSVIEAQWKGKLEELNELLSSEMEAQLLAAVEQNASAIAQNAEEIERVDTLASGKAKRIVKTTREVDGSLFTANVPSILSASGIRSNTICIPRPKEGAYAEFFAMDPCAYVLDTNYLTVVVKAVKNASFYVDMFTTSAT